MIPEKEMTEFLETHSEAWLRERAISDPVGAAKDWLICMKGYDEKYGKWAQFYVQLLIDLIEKGEDE